MWAPLDFEADPSLTLHNTGPTQLDTNVATKIHVENQNFVLMSIKYMPILLLNMVIENCICNTTSAMLPFIIWFA